MNIKKAFTLAETLIVFIIIGIIISLGVGSVRPWEKSFKYSYMRLYNTISLAVYNHMINVDPNTLAFAEDADEFCASLLEYINTAGSPDEYKGSDGKLKCKGEILKADTPYAFRPDAIPVENIKASNGVNFWIGANPDGKPYEYEAVETIEKTDASGNKITNSTKDKVKFYLVYVDLNGNKKPNTSQWSSDKMADIVAFIVTDKYAVIPIGYPEVDSRYIEARVIYPSWDFTGDEDTNSYSEDEDITSDAMSYYEAKIHAYDMDKDASLSEIIGTIMTYDFNNSTLIKGTISGQYSDYYVEDYNSHYETVPSFNSTQCNSEGYTEPVCTVKIYDYQ